MQRSESINELATALAKAQAMMKPAPKDSVNPHFKSRYSDLASVMEALREPLSSNGLSLCQPVSTANGDVTIETILMHISGQFIAEPLTLTPQQRTPQGIGSAATYGRRYGAMAMTGLSSDDDDGELASTPPPLPQWGSQPKIQRDDAPRYDPTPEDVPFQGPPATIGDVGPAVYTGSPDQTTLMRSLAASHGIDEPKDLRALSCKLLGRDEKGRKVTPAVDMDHITAAVKDWVDERRRKS